MYTIDQLHSLTKKPKINDISLSLLQDYYEAFLSPFIYVYTIDDGVNTKQIEVDFKPDYLCHLLAIEKIYKKTVAQRDLVNYRGILGWDNIRNSTIDFSTLIAANKREFKNSKDKYVYFYTLPLLFDKPSAVLFGNKQYINTNVDCEMLFYDVYDNAYVNIGLSESSTTNRFFPRTLLIERITAQNNGKKFIDGNTQITVAKKPNIILV